MRNVVSTLNVSITNQDYYKISLYLMAVLYIAAGINHCRSPQFYLEIMPPYLPYPYLLVALSGVFELLLGFLLLFQKTRNLAGWGIVFLLIAVFPANIQMLVNYFHESNPRLWIAIIRLPLQLPLIYWAYRFTNAART